MGSSEVADSHLVATGLLRVHEALGMNVSTEGVLRGSANMILATGVCQPDGPSVDR